MREEFVRDVREAMNPALAAARRAEREEQKGQATARASATPGPLLDFATRPASLPPPVPTPPPFRHSRRGSGKRGGDRHPNAGTVQATAKQNISPALGSRDVPSASVGTSSMCFST